MNTNSAQMSHAKALEILGLSCQGTEDDIRRAYHAKALKWHPGPDSDAPKIHSMILKSKAARETAPANVASWTDEGEIFVVRNYQFKSIVKPDGGTTAEWESYKFVVDAQESICVLQHMRQDLADLSDELINRHCPHLYAPNRFRHPFIEIHESFRNAIKIYFLRLQFRLAACEPSPKSSQTWLSSSEVARRQHGLAETNKRITDLRTKLESAKGLKEVFDLQLSKADHGNGVMGVAENFLNDVEVLLHEVDSIIAKEAKKANENTSS